MVVNVPEPVPLPPAQPLQPDEPVQGRPGRDPLEHELEHGPPHGQRPDTYHKHARMHETATDPIRPPVMVNGVVANPLRYLNFRNGFTVSENGADNRYDLDVGGAGFARVYRNSGQTLTTGVRAAIAFDSEYWDTGNFHDNVTNNTRLTIPATGVYLLSGHILFDVNTTGHRLVDIMQNGSLFIGSQNAPGIAGTYTFISVSTIYYLSAGAYVELTGLQTSGGNLNVVRVGNISPEFAIQRVG